MWGSYSAVDEDSRIWENNDISTASDVSEKCIVKSDTRCRIIIVVRREGAMERDDRFVNPLTRGKFMFINVLQAWRGVEA